MNKLKDLRIEANKTQLDLSKLLNITQSTYSKLELGKIVLTEDDIIKLSQYYNVSTDYLLGQTNKKERLK